MPLKAKSATPIVACVLLVAATVAAYSNTFYYPFIFDDLNDIVGNRSIRNLWPIWQVFVADSPEGTALHGRPVVSLSLAVNYATGGLEPLHYHLTNLAVHVLAGLALFGVVRRTLGLPRLQGRYAGAATPLAFVVAGIWMLHPLQTQAVTYVTQRYESMMGMFYLVSLYCAIRSDSSAHPRCWAAASVAACLAAMGCKEVAVSAPLLILLYDRAFLAGSFGEAWRRRRGMYLGLAATWLALLLQVQFSAARDTWAGYALPTSWREYAVSQLGVILHYLRLSFWPYPQVLDYAWPVARTAAEIVPGAVVVGGLLAATAYALVRWPAWGALGAWFFLILAPTSSILPITDLAFEHRMYLSLAAVVAAAVIAAYELLQRLFAAIRIPGWAKGLTCVAATLAVLAALGAATYLRNQVYQSEWSAWNDVAQKVPNNPHGHHGVGRALYLQGRFTEAIPCFEKALQLDPRFVNARLGLAMALARLGKTDEGVVHARIALDINPLFAETHNILASLLVGQGKTEQAIDHYRKALEIDPHQVNARMGLAAVMGNRDDVEEAVSQYRKALESGPASAEVCHRLANLLARQGKVEEAIAKYQKALEIQPNLADAHYDLANSLTRQGRIDEAVVHYRKALQFKPQSLDAHYNLANSLMTRNETDEAVKHYRMALQIDPRFVNAHVSLARALSLQGKIEEAITHCRKALEVAPQSAEACHNLASLLAGQGRLDEAIEYFQKALAVNPSFVEARYSLGRAFSLQGKSLEAIAQWREALRFRPDEIPLMNALAWELATCPSPAVRNGTEAVRLAERAVQRSGGQVPELLDTLAAAYAEAGRFSEAVQTAQRALTLASGRGDTALANALRARLGLYEAGSAFHAPSPPLTSPRGKP